MVMMVKHIGAILLSLLIIILLFSCTNNRPTANEPITLRFCTFNGGEGFEWDQKLLNKFMESHPNIKIKVINAPWGSYTEKVLVLNVGGIPPDVFWTISGDLPFYASRNILMDISSTVANDPTIDTTKYFPHAIEFCSYQGKLYALPRDVCCLFYTYNKDMFDAAKVPYPDPNWTWDDFLNIAKKLTKDKNGDGRIEQFGTGGSGGGYYWNDVVHMNGTEPLSLDGRDTWITKPEFYEAVQWWVNLSLKYHVAPLQSETSGLGGDLFLNGFLATSLTGPWAFAGYNKDIKFRWDVVNVPRGKAGNKVSLLGLPIAISSKTKHPKEAYELLKFLCYSEEAQTLQAKWGIAMPSRKDLAMSEVFMKQPIMPEHVNLYMQSMLEYTYAQKGYPYSKQVYDTIQSGIELAQLGKMSVKDAMLIKKPIIDKIISKSIRKGELNNRINE
jgi:multiple sugar transport system substrate-binding protein